MSDSLGRIEIESLTGDAFLMQGWGRVANKPFQFHATRGRWTFAVFKNPLLEPWDIDAALDQDGMFASGKWSDDLVPADAVEQAEQIIRKCLAAYALLEE